jgi:hypothetical protein
MKTRLFGILMVAIMGVGSTACIVHTHDRGRRGCGPGYHWERGGCYPNGRGKHRGHGKDKVIIRDHRR